MQYSGLGEPSSFVPNAPASTSGIPQLWQKVSFVSFIPKVYQNFWVGKNTPHPFPKKLGKLTFTPPKTAPGSHLARKMTPKSRKVKKSSSEKMLFFQKHRYFGFIYFLHNRTSKLNKNKNLPAFCLKSGFLQRFTTQTNKKPGGFPPGRAKNSIFKALLFF